MNILFTRRFIRRIVDLNHLRTLDKFSRRVEHFIRWIELPKLRQWIATYPLNNDFSIFVQPAPGYN